MLIFHYIKNNTLFARCYNPEIGITMMQHKRNTTKFLKIATHTSEAFSPFLFMLNYLLSVSSAWPVTM